MINDGHFDNVDDGDMVKCAKLNFYLYFIFQFFCHVDKNHIHVSVVCDVNKNPYLRCSRWAT